MRVYQFRHIRGRDQCTERPRTADSRRYHGAVGTERLQTLLESAFPNASEVKVIDRGGGDHFQVIVASPSFHGLTLLQQHAQVNDALAVPLDDGTIHELRIKTKGAP